MNIALLLTDTAGGTALGLARSVPGTVTAYLVGSRASAELLATHVDAVVHCEPEPAVPAEAYAAHLAQLVAAAQPDVVIGDSGATGRVLAAAVALALGTNPITAVTHLAPGQVTHVKYGGLVNNTLALVAPAVLLTSPGASLAAGPGAAPITTVAAPPPAGVCSSASTPRATTGIDIGHAERVVAIGRGFAAREDLALANDLARALGAQVGCTRPLAEGVAWLPPEQYVGVSGVPIRPRLYVGVGLSGQIQHLAGVDAEVIVGINTDPACPLLRQADYAVVGDLYQILPALIAQLQAGT